MELPSLRRSRISYAEAGRALVKGFAATIDNPKMVAFFPGLFAPIAGQSLPFGARVMVLVGIVLVDLTYHLGLFDITLLIKAVLGRFPELDHLRDDFGCSAAFAR